MRPLSGALSEHVMEKLVLLSSSPVIPLRRVLLPTPLFPRTEVHLPALRVKLKFSNIYIKISIEIFCLHATLVPTPALTGSGSRGRLCVETSQLKSSSPQWSDSYERYLTSNQYF